MTAGVGKWLLPMLALAAPALSLAGAPYAGRALSETLGELRRDGLHILYGSDLVTAGLPVVYEPTATTLADVAREVLAPHGLTIANGPAGRWLVVRAKEVLVQPGLVVETPGGQTPEALAQVTVTAGRYSLGDISSSHYLSRKQIAATPHIADDPLRIMRQLPGITGSDFSASLHVRGGARDEAAILVDGVRIHDPFHLKNLQGALGLIDAGIVEGIDVMTGGFGAEYGDRLSGMIAMRTLDPAETYETTVGASFVNAFVRSRGPMADGRGHWLVSVRRGYLDWLFELIDSSGDFTPRYWDVFTKADWALGSATVVTGNLLVARDELRYVENVGANERSLGQADSANVWASASTRWSSALSSDTVVSMADIDRQRDNANATDGLVAAVDDQRHLSFATLRTDWQWQARPDFLMRFGGEIRHTRAEYDYVLASCLADPFPSGPCIDRSFATDLSIGGESYAIHASGRWRATPRIVAELGLRADRQTFAGFAENQFSPRLSLRAAISPRSSLTLGWGLYSQSQQPEELQVEDRQHTLAPVESLSHLALGWQSSVGEGYALRAEVYDKHYRNPRARYENLFDTFDVLPEAKADRIRVFPQGSRVRGAELSLAAPPQSELQWQLQYAWQKARDHIAGRDVPRSWDETHNLAASLNWSFKRWTVGAFALLRSGWPTTPLSFNVRDEAEGVTLQPLVGVRNSDRLPRYARLDLRLSRSHLVPSGEFSFFFELYNALDNSNRCCVDDAIVYRDAGGAWRADPEYDDWLPRLPSFGFTWTFR